MGMVMGRNLILVLIIQLLCPWNLLVPALAQEAPAAQAAPVNLDLSSAERNVAASDVLSPTAQATINLAGIARTISPTDMLTAAEMVAVRQVVNTGNQYLQLNAVGAAIGGGIHLSYYAANGISNLVIPEGVRASQNAALLQSLNLTGNLANSGTLNVFSSNAAFTSASINANNIYNNTGALISSTLANLTLNAINNIVNAGTIMSSGNLSLTAGNSIINNGVMQAMQNLNLQSSLIANQAQMAAVMGNVNAVTANLVNSGMMQALAGKLTVEGMSDKLTVNNQNGILSAAKELSIINRTVTKSLVDVQGGTLLGSEVHFDSNDGHLNVNIDDLAGDVHVSAGTAHFAINAGTHPFYMASWQLTGDPDLILNVSSYDDGGVGFDSDGGVVEITTTSGGITFSGTITTTANTNVDDNGGHVYLSSASFISLNTIDTSANASGTGSAGEVRLSAITDITMSNDVIAASTEGNGGNVIMTAGGNIDISGDVTTTSTGIAGNAGSVTLDAAGGFLNVNNITAKSERPFPATGDTGNGGNVWLNAGADMTIADVLTDSLSSVDDTGTGGIITIIAGTSITAGTLSSETSTGFGTSNNSGDGGAINLSAGTTINITQAVSTSLTYGSGGTSGDAGAITMMAGDSITASNGIYATSYGDNAGNGSDVIIISANDLDVSEIWTTSTSPNGDSGNAGNILLIANDAISIGGGTGLLASYSVSMSSSGTSGKGGNQTLTAVTSFIAGSIDTHSTAADDSGRGGTVTITTGTSIATDSNIETYSYANTAGDSGTGGSVTLSAGTSIDTGQIEVSSLTANGNSGSSGNITLTAGTTINTNYLYSRSTSFSTGSSGATGNITLTAGGAITASELDTSAASQGGAGDAGNITVMSNLSINTEGLFASSSSVFGNSGNGGNVVVVAMGGNIVINGYIVTLTDGSSTIAGSISLVANGTISTQYVDSAATGNAGQSGNVFISSGDTSGDASVVTGDINTSAGAGGTAGNVFLGANSVGTNGQSGSSSSGSGTIQFTMTSFGGGPSTPNPYLFYDATNNPSTVVDITGPGPTTLSVTTSNITILPGVYTSSIGSSLPVDLILDLDGDSRTVVPIVSTGDVNLAGLNANTAATLGYGYHMVIVGGTGISLSGDINGTVDASNTHLAALGTGSISQSSGTVYSINKVNLFATGGDIGSGAHLLEFAADTISTATVDGGNNLVLNTSANPLNVDVAIAGVQDTSVFFGYVQIRSNSSINVNSAVVGHSAALVTTAGDSDIALSNDFVAKQVGAIIASGEGNITQSGGRLVVLDEQLQLVSSGGNIGTDANSAINIIGSTGISANTSTSGDGTVYLNVLGGHSLAFGSGFFVYGSSSGGDFILNVSGGGIMTLTSIKTGNGNIQVTTSNSITALNVYPASELTSTGGSITLQNNNLANGTITIGNGVTIKTLGGGDIYIGLGPIPGSPVAGSTPDNVEVTEGNGGQVFFGTNSISANSPNNYVTSTYGGSVVFNTGSRLSSAIVLDGDVRINSKPPELFSLDFTDPNLTSLVISLQGQGIIGGTLIVDGGGIATGGDAIIAPSNLAASLSAYNVPVNVTITLEDFTETDNVAVAITAASTSNQGLLGGTFEFTGTNPVGNLTFTSTEAGPVLVIDAGAQLTSTGNLVITADSITNSGNILSTTNGTITVITNNLINDAVTSNINAGPFGTVKIFPLNGVAMYVGGTTHSGVTLDITTADMEHITSGVLTLGDLNYATGITLVGNVDVHYDDAFNGARNYNLNLYTDGDFDSDGYSITLGFNQLHINSTGAVSTNQISGTNTVIEIFAGESLTINDSIEAVDPNNAFSVNGNIHLYGSPILFNLDPGEYLNAGTYNGIISLDPSTTMDVIFFAPSTSGITFDITESDLNHIKTYTLNIGSVDSASSITLGGDVELGFSSSYANLNLSTGGGFDYNGFGFAWDFRSGMINANGNIEAGEMSDGRNLTMRAGGYVNLNGSLQDFENVTLIGAPVFLNGNSIESFASVTLRPTNTMDIYVGGTTVSGITFDITAGDLANITTEKLVIGSTITGNTLTVVDNLDISGPSFQSGHYNLTLLSNGAFTSEGTAITIGRDIFDNSSTLTITTYSDATLGSITSAADTGATVIVTAAGEVNLTANIDVADGDSSGRIELRGSPVSLNGNSLDAGQFGFIALAPTSDMNVAIADAAGTAAPFDVSAGDLANITTATLQIGDIYHTSILTVEDDMDLSGSGPGAYGLVLVSSTNVLVGGNSIILGAGGLGLSTNGGRSNIATNDLDISYLFDGNLTWRPNTSSNFYLETGGSSSANYVTGIASVDLSAASGLEGQIDLLSGSAYSYNPVGAVITMSGGSSTSASGGNINLYSVNFTTTNGDITATALGYPLDFMNQPGSVAIGSVNATGSTSVVNVTADSGATIGGRSVSRVTGDLTISAGGGIQSYGAIYASNIDFTVTANDGGVFVSDSLYATNEINIASNGTGMIGFSWTTGLAYIEAPTISINSQNGSIFISDSVEIVTPVNLTTSGSITITSNSINSDGLIAALGANATLVIASFDNDSGLMINGNGKMVADPLSGLITFNCPGGTGNVQVTQAEIAGKITSTSANDFSLTTSSGILTLGNITAGSGQIIIQTGGDIHVSPGSVIEAGTDITLGSTNGGNSSLLISGTSIEAISGELSFNDFTYVKNDSNISAGTAINMTNFFQDLVLIGNGVLEAPEINLQSDEGAVIATQDDMLGTVNVSSQSTLVLNILNPSISFTPGTLVSTDYDTASVPSGFTSLYAATNPTATTTLGDAVFATTTGSFDTFTVSSGTLQVAGSGNMVIIILNDDAGITDIGYIATGGGSLYIDTTLTSGLTFTGNLDTTAAFSHGGNVILNSAGTIETRAIYAGGTDDAYGGQVWVTAAGDITVHDFIDTRGAQSGSGGNVTIVSEGGNVTFDTTGDTNITTFGGGGSSTNGGNILIGAGGAISLTSYLDSSAESAITSGSQGNAGWIYVAGSSISSTSGIKAAGGGDFNGGNGGDITLVAGSITIGDLINSAGTGGGFGGDITIHASNEISILSANSTGGQYSFSEEDGGYIVIQSDTLTVTATGYLDSSAAFFEHLDGGGNAGMIFVVAPTAINGFMTYRAEGRSKPQQESSSLYGNGNNIRIETNGIAELSFVSSSAQSNVAPLGGAPSNGGRIDVIAHNGVDGNTFKSTGGQAGGNGGDINITADNGNISISFLFTTAFANDIYSGEAYGDGGNINISAPDDDITINSFIDTGGAAGNFGNGGSVTITGHDIVSHSYLAANGGVSGGNGGNITLLSTGTDANIDFEFSLDSSARQQGGNGGIINVTAVTGIQSTIVSAAGGTIYGHGGNINLQLTDTGNIEVGSLNSSARHNTLPGSSNAGNIFVSSPEGNVTVGGIINTSTQGVSGDAGNVTILFNSASDDFVIDPAGTFTNGIAGAISAQATGAGNGGIVTLVNSGGDLDIVLNDIINVQSDSGNAGSINFNYAQDGIDVTPNVTASVTVTGGTSGVLVGPVFASGEVVSISLNSNSTLSLADITATAGSITAAMGSLGQELAVLAGRTLQATQGNIYLQFDNTSSGSITLGSGSTLTANGDGYGNVYVVIGSIPGSPTPGTPPANMIVSEINGGQVYFGDNSITASAPDNHVNTNGSLVVFDTGSLSASAISLGGNVTINGTSQPVGGGPIFSLDFTDPTLTALILLLQGSEEIGGTLIVNEQGVATGGNAIIGSNMLSSTLTSTNIPTGITITFNGFTNSNPLNIAIDSESYTNVATIAGTAEFINTGSSGGLITINSDQASQNGRPAFVLTGTGQLLSAGSLSLSASGNIFLDGTVSAATDLIVQTTANNGNISIAGNVSAANSVSLSTNGNGTVMGTVNSPALTFTSSMGNLGNSPSDRFVANANSLSVTTGGNAYITNSSDATLTLGTITARNFHISNDHAIVVNNTLQIQQSTEIIVTDHNGGVTFNGNVTSPNYIDVLANGTGDILQNGGIIRTSGAYLSTGSGDIGSAGNPIQTTAFYLTFITSTGDVHINTSNSLRIHHASSGSTVDITSNGQIEVANPISATDSVTFHGAGSIILSANITAPSFATLYGQGHGNILNNGGSLITPVLTTSTGSGTIGSDTTAISTTATTISSTNQGSNNTNITGGQTTNITEITAGSVTVTSDGNLNIGNVQTINGSIELTGSGTVTVTNGSTIHANEGNIDIHNNSSTGTITLEQNSTVEAFTGSASGLGNVSITVGTSVGTSGSTGSNVSENIQGGGQIVVGNNGFEAEAPNNNLNAIGATITIDAGASGTINLGGNVTITADPPISATSSAISSQAVVATTTRFDITAPAEIANVLPLLSVTSSSNSASMTNSATLVRSQVSTDATIFSSPTAMQLPAASSHLPSSSSILNTINNFNQVNLIELNPQQPSASSNQPTQSQAEDSAEPTAYLPIAYTTSTAPTADTIVNSAHELTQTDFGTCSVRHSGAANVSYNQDSVILHSGEILIHSPHHTTVNAGGYSISVDPGSVALITREGSILKVRALHESHTNAIVITAGNTPIKVSIGQEVMLAPSSTHLQVAAQKDNLGRRHVVDAELPNGHAMSRSEFSHMTLIEQSSVLTKLIQSKSPADKQLADKLVKTAACLMTVTGAHGAFSSK